MTFLYARCDNFCRLCIAACNVDNVDCYYRHCNFLSSVKYIVLRLSTYFLNRLNPLFFYNMDHFHNCLLLKFFLYLRP